MDINIYIYIYRGSLCFDFSEVQCSIRKRRTRYILRQGKNIDYSFILTSLFRDYSHIRDFIIKSSYKRDTFVLMTDFLV